MFFEGGCEGFWGGWGFGEWFLVRFLKKGFGMFLGRVVAEVFGRGFFFCGFW